MTKALAVQQATSAERILSTALDLFAVRGYDATAVREICEAAGITKPTLYHFFGSKDGVLQALVQGGFEQFRALVQAAIETPGHSGIASRCWRVWCSRAPARSRGSGASSTASSGRRPARPRLKRKTAREFYDGVVGALATAAQEAVASGELRPGRSRRGCSS